MDSFVTESIVICDLTERERERDTFMRGIIPDTIHRDVNISRTVLIDFYFGLGLRIFRIHSLLVHRGFAHGLTMLADVCVTESILIASEI